MNKELIQNKKLRETQIISWANFIRKNPNSWKKQHTEFVDSQIRRANKFYEKLKDTQNGNKKICELRINRWKMNKKEAIKYREFYYENKKLG